QRGTRGGAVLRMVMAGEAHALGGELVDVWRFVVLGALAAQVGPAEVVGEDEDDVGALAGLVLGGRRLGRGADYHQGCQAPAEVLRVDVPLPVGLSGGCG